MNTSIKKRLTKIVLLTTGTCLLLVSATFVLYEFLAIKRSSINELSTLGKIIATNSSAALAFEDKENANEILSVLHTEHNIKAAVLYDNKGLIFASYPNPLPEKDIPKLPQEDGYVFNVSHISGFQSVKQEERFFGTLYLKAGSEKLFRRLNLYGGIVVSVISASLLLSLFLSNRLQFQIVNPIIELAETAKIISHKHDYSVRVKTSKDYELGILTNAFNQMLSHIESQTTAIRANKEKLENIVQNMGDAYVSLDREWKYTYANSRALQLIGKSEEDLLGNVIWDLYPEISNTEFEVIFRSAMDDRKPQNFEAYYADYNIWLEVRAYPSEEGISIFYTDISKYKKAEEEIKSFNEDLENMVKQRTTELQAANHELESFSYSVSHDLRAPLRAIHGYMSILQKRYASQLDEDGNKIMKIIGDSATKMGCLIDDLLKLSRLGRKALSLSTFSMHDLVLEIFNELKRQEEDRKIEFHLDAIPTATADYNTIHQVWVNLISNALKYTSHKENTIIEVGSYTEDDHTIYFIKDNGAGFDMAYYDKLFGVFQRMHTEKEFEGTGVGLAIVQRIVTKHGGKIWANAKLDHGASFFFYLT